MKKLLSALALCVWTLSSPAETIIWTNTASGNNWSVAANWSPNQVPTLTNDVFITNNGTYTVVQNVSANARSLTLGGETGTQTLVMAASQLKLSVTNVLTVNAQGVLQGGFSGNITNFGGIVVHGRLRAEGGGGLNVNGNGPTVISIGSGAALDMTTDLILRNCILLNAGRATAGNGEQILLGNSSAFTNQASGTIIFTNNNSGIHFATGGNTNVFFANEGQIHCHNSAGINVPMALGGTVDVLAGQFSLGRSTSFSAWHADITGAITVAAGATLACGLGAGAGGTFDFRPGSSLTGAGNLHVGNSFSPTVNLNGTYAITGLLTNWSGRINFNTGSPLTIPNAGFSGSGAVVGGEDTLTFTGPLFTGTIEFTGTGGVIIGTTGQATLGRGGCEVLRPWMANAGTVQAFAALLELGANSVFTNLPGGSIVFTNDATSNSTEIRSPSDGTSAFYNEGTVRWACAPSDSRVPFFNAGTLRIERELPFVFRGNLFQTAGLTELAGGGIRFSVGSGGIDLTGGVLGGTGSIINGSVTNRGGTISPGASPGQINIQRRLGIRTNAAVNIELAGTEPGSGFDQIIVGEHVSFGGTLNVSLANGFIPAVGTKFLIFTPATTRSGAFDTFNYPSNQVTLQLNYPPNGSVELEALAIPVTLSPGNVTLISGESQTFTASGGTAPYSFSLVENNSGGSIDATSGLYTAGPTNGVTDIIRVTDSMSATGQATVQVIAPLQISPTNVARATGETNTFTASGGTPPYSFTLGTNNSGGSIDASDGVYVAGPTNGVIDTVHVADSASRTAQATIQVIAALAILPANVTRASGEEQIFTPLGGTPPYAFALLTNNSGAHMFSDASHALYVAGTTNGVTDAIRVMDADSRIAVATVQVIAPLEISPTNVTLISGQTQTFTASGGTTPYAFTFVQNNSGGTIDGASGLYTAGPTNEVTDTVRVTDSANRAAGATVSVASSEHVLVVTNAADFGPGTLLAAITTANSSSRPLCRIHFDLALPAIIQLPREIPLPALTRAVVIDGTTQPGFSNTPIVQIAGNHSSFPGFRILANNCVVRGLVVKEFKEGIRISAGLGNVIERNLILSNDGSGIWLEGTAGQSFIGGSNSLSGNVIAFNGLNGVTVLSGTGHSIRGNAISDNTGEGIALGLSSGGIPANDADDADTGPNNLQNHPRITSVINPGLNPTIRGALESTPNSVFALDFYANTECGPSGHAEGKRHLGFMEVVTDGNGNATFDFAPSGEIVDANEIVTATATDAAGNTSAFSECGGVVSTISGQVQRSGATLADATVTLFGTRSGTTTTDVSGNFAFNDLPIFGAYTVVPSRTGFTFTPQSQSFSNLSSPGVANFVAAVGNFRIVGTVKDNNGNPIVRTRIELSGGATDSTLSDNRGEYAFKNLPGFANYTLNASRNGFIFSGPTNINNLQSNVRVDFTGTPAPRTIAGTVRTSSGNSVAGITLKIFPFSFLTPGPVLQTAQSDAQGAYQFGNLPSNQRYLVRAFSSEVLFAPESATLFLSGADLLADFTTVPAHRISGRVTERVADQDQPVAGATVRFNQQLSETTGRRRGSVLTDANGNYTSPLLPDGFFYDIIASKPGLGFNTIMVVQVENEDEPGIDFSGVRQSYAISGRILNAAGFSMNDVVLSLGGGTNLEQTAHGTFSFLDLPGGNSYTVTPGRTGFTFAPSNIVINLLSNDQQMEFRAAPRLPLTGRIALIDDIPRVMNADSTGIQPASSSAEPGGLPDADFGFGLSADELIDIVESTFESDTTTWWEGVALSPDSKQMAFTETTYGVADAGIIGALIGTGTLKRQQINSSVLPAELAEDARGKPSWSANGSRIAFVKDSLSDAAPGLYVINPDGSSGTLVSGTELNDRDPALSPDGNQLAFAGRVGEQYDIFIVNVNGTGLTRVTTDPADDLEPAWSPNGNNIAFASSRNGDFEIFRMDTQQFDLVQLTSNDAEDRKPTWSPDGTMIAFRSGSIIHAMNASDGSLETPLRVGSSPSWGALPTLVTPPGNDVQVTAGVITVNFDSVTAGGTTTIIPLSTDDSTLLPQGYFQFNITDSAFDVVTTAAVTPPITVCVAVHVGVPEEVFNAMHILHEENGQLIDRTFSHNFATRTICAQVSSLSPFRLVQQIDRVKATVTGLVVDSRGLPISRVLVSLGGSSQGQTLTDIEGRFTLANLASSGTYSVTPVSSQYAFIQSAAFFENLTGTNTVVFTAIPIAVPTLTISRSQALTSSFDLIWPVESWPFILESTSSLASPDWTPVLNSPARFGNNFVVTVQADGATRFFRLRQ